MGKFSDKARKATSNSWVLEGRTKVTQEDVIRNHKDGITVTAFDIMKGKDKQGNPSEYAVIAFKEEPDKAFFAGSVLTGICKEWLDGYESSEAASADLADDGGVRIKLSTQKSKEGRTYTAVEVID